MIRCEDRRKAVKGPMPRKIGRSRLSADPDKHQRQDYRPGEDCLKTLCWGKVLVHDGYLHRRLKENKTSIRLLMRRMEEGVVSGCEEALT